MQLTFPLNVCAFLSFFRCIPLIYLHVYPQCINLNPIYGCQFHMAQKLNNRTCTVSMRYDIKLTYCIVGVKHFDSTELLMHVNHKNPETFEEKDLEQLVKKVSDFVRTMTMPMETFYLIQP